MLLAAHFIPATERKLEYVFKIFLYSQNMAKRMKHSEQYLKEAVGKASGRKSDDLLSQVHFVH